MNPFHLAFPVDNLAEARTFYTEVLGCGVGRSSDAWIDFDLFGHQVVAHLSPKDVRAAQASAVDGDAVPVRHFGVVLSMDEWKSLAEKLEAMSIDFIIPPKIRFEGQAGEQATMFFSDPAGNALEFKAFKNMDQLFATE